METTAPTGASLLDRIDVRSPCTADWNRMTGDERRRRCGLCKLHVYNLSAMTRDDAEQLLAKRRGERTCVRFARRADGTIVSADCLTIAARLRRRMHIAAAALVGLLGFGTSWLAGQAADSGGLNSWRTWQKQPFRSVGERLPDAWVPQEPVQILMGDMICLPAPASPDAGRPAEALAERAKEGSSASGTAPAPAVGGALPEDVEGDDDVR